VALRAGKKIYYDGANMRHYNALQANDFLRREYRKAGRPKKSSCENVMPAPLSGEWLGNRAPAGSGIG